MTSAAALRSRDTQSAESAKRGRPGEDAGTAAGLPSYLGGVAGGGGAPAFLQRQPEEIAEEEQTPESGLIQRLPHDPFPTEQDDADEDPVIQAKLTINQPGDAYEAEADAVADAVTSGGQPSPAGTLASPPSVQRKCATCGDAQADDEPCPDCAAKVQRKESGPGPTRPSGRGAADAVARPGAGEPMSPATRAPIEAHLGTDLSHVRVHRDHSAQEAAASIQAKAFTHGDHIWLGSGQRADDVELMAHEATHTVQQRQGGQDPALIQRAPSDHQHPEDGSAPRARIEAEIEGDLEDAGERDSDEPEPEIDTAEKRAKAEPLKDDARPDTDRPAQEAPKVSQAAGIVQAEADQPGEEVVEGQAAEPDAAPPEAPEPPAPSQNPVDAAAAAIASLPEPEVPDPVVPPPITAPVDADGQPLPPEAQSEALVQTAAAQLQMSREAAFGLRQKARQQRANAIVLRGNIALADQHIGEAESGLVTAHGAMETRREVISEAENAHATSEAKAETVASEAPDVQSEAEEAQDESGPMASEASDTAAENDANAPDDPDAAGDSAEAGGKITSVASDSASMDQASGATRERAVQLQADAESARTRNAEAMGKIDAAKASADQTDGKLGEMDGQTTQARSEVEPLKSRPDEAEAQALALDQRAASADARTDAMAADLARIQQDYQSDMERVPGAKSLSEQNEGNIQRAEGEGAAAGGGAAPVAYAPRGYEGRRKVELPNFQIGPPLTEEQRQKRAEDAAAAEARRRARIEALQNGSHGNFSELTATDKAGIALDFMLEDAFSKAGNIKWPDFSAGSVGKALLNIIDPRGPLNGILGGLSTVASGALNLFDMDQWQRDPLGNLLKSAADIATGITVILGSIVALLGVVVAICAAAIVLSFGTLAAALGPVIAWCTSAGITVGGWTISVGLLALYYQGLLIIKNIVDVMTAETAEELVVNTEQLEGDFAQVGEIGMQMGTAYLGAKGGPGMLDDIAENGIRRVAQQEVFEGLRDAAIEVGAGEDIAGAIGVARMAHGVHAASRSGGGGGGDADGGGAPRAGDEAPASRPDAEGGQRPVEADAEAPPQQDTAAPAGGAEQSTPPSQSLPPMEGAPAPRPAEGAEPTPSVDLDTQPPNRQQPDADATQKPGAEAEPDAGGDASQAPAAPSAGRADAEPSRPEIDTEGPAAPRGEDAGAAGPAARDAATGTPGDADGAKPRPDEPDGSGPRRQQEEADVAPRADDPAALRDAASKKTVAEMSPAERRAEADQANAAPRDAVTDQKLRDLDFESVAHLDNGKDFIFAPKDGVACRVSNQSCGPTKNGEVQPDAMDAAPDKAAELDAARGDEAADAGATRPAEEDAAPGTQRADEPAGLPPERVTELREGTVADKDGTMPIIEASPGKADRENGPGSLEHKVEAWAEYRDGAKKGENANLDYEAWSTKYDTLDRIRDTANAEARAYNEELLKQARADEDVDVHEDVSGHEKTIPLAGEEPRQRADESDEDFKARQTAHAREEAAIKAEVESVFRQLEADKKDPEGTGKFNPADLDDLAKNRTKRRPDAAIVSKEKGAPVPLLPDRRLIEYKSGDVSRTDKILMEAARDIVLARKGYDVEWVIAGHISAPLEKVLRSNGIIVKVL